MKKVLSTILAFVIIFSGIGMVNAQEIEVMDGCELMRDVTYQGTTYTTDQGVIDEDSVGDVWPIICIMDTINRAAQVLYFIMMGLVTAMVVLGGFFILLGGGSEDNVTKGKKFITYAIVGVFIGAFAYAVPAILSFIMG